MRPRLLALLAWAAREVPAQLEEITCNDPRFQDGGKLIGGLYVTLNELSSDIALSASATQYGFDEAVHVTVTANGSRFVNGIQGDASHGVFLALQVEFTGPTGEAMGAFHNLSSDLQLTPNCASSLISKRPFSGTSFFSWTPSTHAFELGMLQTNGNATFKLAWTNNPEGSDQPVPNPYLYLKTLTLTEAEAPEADSRTSTIADGPEKSATAAAAGPAACVLNASDLASVDGVAHAFKRSPVFVQRVQGGAQTFPAERCIRCRHGTACSSARVECPIEPGLPVVEKLWLESDSCSGPPSLVSGVADVVCPGPSHWHPDSLNLTRFVPKLRRDYPEEIPDDATAEAALAEYRRMLALVQLDPAQSVVPSRLVDLAWHSHILDTAAYERDTLRLFGHYLHHSPSFGGSEEREELVQQQDTMLRRYEDAFGEQPGVLWNRSRRLGKVEFPALDQEEVWKMQKSPDCCSANCVKLNCAGCVGCNSIDCGYLGAGGGAPKRPRRPLSPAQFEGYVPSSSAAPLGAPAPKYLCSASPYDKITLSWTVVGDRVHLRLESKVEAWFGIGLANGSSSGMGDGVDYNFVMNDRNYTNVVVRDAYKWDPGNGWPCWDVLYECSPKNGTRGRKDTEDDSIVKTNGYTTATWNRKLATGDSKDFDIADGMTRVLFAYGVDDYFTYHQDFFGECMLNFFSGEQAYCWWAGSGRRLQGEYVV